MADPEIVDLIIIGSGSAGCVLADKLSRDGRLRIMVLEAGGHDQRLWIKMPVGYGKLFYDRRVNWKFEAQPDAGLNGRRIYFPRGKVVGGSSSINAMVYCRGLPQDFDDWQAAGNPGWGWDDVRPVYESFERPIDPDGRATGHGPLCISDVRRELHPLEKTFFTAASQTGLPFTDDFNGDCPEGVGRYRINTRAGRRWSAADAFLRPALRRTTVTLRTRAAVSRILFEGRRACGVRYLQDGVVREARARQAVILSAGAVQSPQLLQVSGVGPGDLLHRLGIPVVHANNAVGGNLQDHLAMSYYYESRQPTLNQVLGSPWGLVGVGLRYLLTRRGPLSISVNQCGGFVRSDPDRGWPDLQLYCNPITYTLATSDQGTQIVPDRYPGFILCFQPCRPRSRGRIDIDSPDASIPPRIQPRYLDHDDDIQTALRGARLIRQLERAPAFRDLIVRPVEPALAALDDDGMVNDFRSRASTCYHPVGTCMMGCDANASVVGPDLKVHGVDGLYVIDASVFPNVTSGNTHAPTTMVAHRGADAVLRAMQS